MPNKTSIKLPFGKQFTCHMVRAHYTNGTWQKPTIVPFGSLELSPATLALHYGQIVFEGLKAFRWQNSRLSIFRLDRHYNRLTLSCQRLAIPPIPKQLFYDVILEFVKLEQDWIPTEIGHSLYLRPFIFASDPEIGVKISNTYEFVVIASPVSRYFDIEPTNISLVTSTPYSRTAPGGLGRAKTPANYASTLLPSREAAQRGYAQILWLDAVTQSYIEEAGTMNIFFRPDAQLITPPLGDTILDGTIRNSVISLAKQMDIPVVERRISVTEMLEWHRSGHLDEIFGTGTAAGIIMIDKITHRDTLVQPKVVWENSIGRLLQDRLISIQHGLDKDEFGWCFVIPEQSTD